MLTESHLPRSLRATAAGRAAVVIRHAGEDDRTLLLRLAELSERGLPRGPFLLAEADGEPVAARSLSTGDVLADPFRVAYDLVDLLEVRARHLEAA